MPSQIDAWTGEFGDAYHERNSVSDQELQHRRSLWGPVLDLIGIGTVPIDVLEVGAGTGANLETIRTIRPWYNIYALEPNKKVSLDYSRVYGTAEHIDAVTESFDLVFTYGVLIHLPDLPLPAMREIYRVSRRFIMCAEYFAPKREAIPYRDGVPLFRDDYGSLWMDNFDLDLRGYGFCWKRMTGLDNITWWLFEREPSF